MHYNHSYNPLEEGGWGGHSSREKFRVAHSYGFVTVNIVIWAITTSGLSNSPLQPSTTFGSMKLPLGSSYSLSLKTFQGT